MSSSNVEPSKKLSWVKRMNAAIKKVSKQREREAKAQEQSNS